MKRTVEMASKHGKASNGRTVSNILKDSDTTTQAGVIC